MAVTVRTVRGPPRSTTTTLTARQERDVRPSLTSAAEEGPAPAMVKVPEPPPDNTPGLLAVTVRTVRATTVAPHEPRQHQPHAAGGERAYEHGGHKGHRPQQQAVTFREEPAMLSPSSPEQGVWRELLMSPRSPIAVLTTVSPFGDTGDDAAETAGPGEAIVGERGGEGCSLCIMLQPGVSAQPGREIWGRHASLTTHRGVCVCARISACSFAFPPVLCR